MPDCPAISRDQLPSTPTPSGETAPIPVTTMRRMELFRFTISPQVAEEQRSPLAGCAVDDAGGTSRRRIASWRGADQFRLRSTAMAVASPPPMQSEAMPRLTLFFSIACSSVTIRRAPVCADGMAERAGAAVDVELVARNSEIARRRHRHHGEGFVDFEQVDIADAPADLVEQFADRGDWRGGEPRRFLRMRRVAPDFGEDRQAFTFGDRAPRQHKGRRAVGVRRRGCGRDRAVRTERGLEVRDFGGIDLQRVLVVFPRHARRLFPSRRSVRFLS